MRLFVALTVTAATRRRRRRRRKRRWQQKFGTTFPSVLCAATQTTAYSWKSVCFTWRSPSSGAMKILLCLRFGCCFFCLFVCNFKQKLQQSFFLSFIFGKASIHSSHNRPVFFFLIFSTISLGGQYRRRLSLRGPPTLSIIIIILIIVSLSSCACSTNLLFFNACANFPQHFPYGHDSTYIFHYCFCCCFCCCCMLSMLSAHFVHAHPTTWETSSLSLAKA